MRLFAGTKYDQPPKCDRCGKLEGECRCSPPVGSLLPPASQTVNIRLEKRKKGKVVTTIRGLSAGGNDLPALLSRLKSLCGAGGTIQEDHLEVQGDHVERIASALSEAGYRLSRGST